MASPSINLSSAPGYMVVLVGEAAVGGQLPFLGLGAGVGVGSGSDWTELAGVPGWIMI